MKVHDVGLTSCRLENMHVPAHPSMCLFSTQIEGATIIVTFKSPGSSDADWKTIEVPLDPDHTGLDPVHVNMHSSPSIGFNMGPKYNDWFSCHFGFNVILVHWGRNERRVLGNLPSSQNTNRIKSLPVEKSWLATMSSHIPVIGTWFSGGSESLAFNDVAPLLIVTEESFANATARLPTGVKMDITKFRANIVLEGAPREWDEDWWAELKFNGDMQVILTANCPRCTSIVVDYETGKIGTGEAKDMLKLMMKDRRVDPGIRFSPCFGRYGFIGKRADGRLLKVGDEVTVEKRNNERTIFSKFHWQ